MHVSQSTIGSADGHVKPTVGDAVKHIRAVRNACTLIEAVARQQPVGVSELSRVTGIDKSAVQRLVVTLHAAGWLHPHPEPPTRWQISPVNPVLRHAAMPNLASLVQPAADRLRDQSGETAIFVTRIDGRFTVTAVAESHHVMRVSIPVGFVLPIELSSAAAAIAAYLPPGELEPIQQEHPMLDNRQLAQVRRRGWAETKGEVTGGSRAVAAALRGPDGYPIGALALSGPVGRVSVRDLARLGALVVEAAGHALDARPDAAS
jgi:IclR family transcriptional regulator, acetate operon repressor